MEENSNKVGKNLKASVTGSASLVERFLTEGRDHLTSIGSLYLVICLQEVVGLDCLNKDVFLKLVKEKNYHAPQVPFCINAVFFSLICLAQVLKQELLKQEEDEHTLTVYLLRVDPKR